MNLFLKSNATFVVIIPTYNHTFRDKTIIQIKYISVAFLVI